MVCKTILLEEWVTRGISNLSNQEMDHCTNEIVARLGLFARIFLAYLYFFLLQIGLYCLFTLLWRASIFQV